METQVHSPVHSRRVWKHHLPSYYKLTRFKFDLLKLQDEVGKFDEKFTNVFESNKELCLNNPELTNSVEEHYEQVSLTNLKDPMVLSSSSMDSCQMPEEEEGLSKTQKYRLKIGQRFDRPGMDERNYNLPTEDYLNSYIKECVDQFDVEPMRVRLVRLQPGKKVDFHIDYDPSFAVRIIVPVITNPLVFNFTRRGNEVEKIHLAADGHPWFLNTGFAHAVENQGESSRTILMFSLQPGPLIEQISESWKRGDGQLN